MGIVAHDTHVTIVTAQKGIRSLKHDSLLSDIVCHNAITRQTENAMNKRLLVLIPIVAGLFGCASPAPVAQNFPISYQKVARTAHHWDVVADDVVAQTLQVITEKQQLQGRGIYVPAANNTAFNGAFRDFLITHFVDRGANVSVCRMVDSKTGFALDAPDIEVQYDTRVISHSGHMPNYEPGILTILASGVAVLRNAIESPWSRGSANAGLIGAAVLGDVALGHAASTTRTEIVVTTTIAERNRFVMRRSDIYYVPDADAKLFFQRVAQRSACPEDKSVASAAMPDTANAEVARQEQVARDMRRSNPDWRGPSSPTAYAY